MSKWPQKVGSAIFTIPHDPQWNCKSYALHIAGDIVNDILPLLDAESDCVSTLEMRSRQITAMYPNFYLMLAGHITWST